MGRNRIGMEERVWKAIEDALNRVGEPDIQAGLAWMDTPGKTEVAKAAIAAVKNVD